MCAVLREPHAKQGDDMRTGLIGEDKTGATPARFYILFAFCLLSFNQCLFWITFSPIASNAKLYCEGVDDPSVAALRPALC